MHLAKTIFYCLFYFRLRQGPRRKGDNTEGIPNTLIHRKNFSLRKSHPTPCLDNDKIRNMIKVTPPIVQRIPYPIMMFSLVNFNGGRTWRREKKLQIWRHPDCMIIRTKKKKNLTFIVAVRDFSKCLVFYFGHAYWARHFRMIFASSKSIEISVRDLFFFLKMHRSRYQSVCLVLSVCIRRKEITFTPRI